MRSGGLLPAKPAFSHPLFLDSRALCRGTIRWAFLLGLLVTTIATANPAAFRLARFGGWRVAEQTALALDGARQTLWGEPGGRFEGGPHVRAATGSRPALERWAVVNRLLSATLLGAVAASALCLFLLARSRRRIAGGPLFISLIALGMLRILCTSGLLTMAGMPMALVSRLAYLSIFLFPPICAWLLRALFPRALRRAPCRVLTLVGGLAALAVTFLPAAMFTRLRDLAIGFVVMAAVCLLFWMRRAVRARRTSAREMAVGVALLGVAAAGDAVHHWPMLDSVDLVAAGMLAFLFPLGLALGRRILTAPEKHAALSDRLSRLSRGFSERSAMLRTTLRALNSAVVAVDAEDRIVTCNRRFSELFRLDGDVSPGMPRARVVKRLNARAGRFGGGGWEEALLPPAPQVTEGDRDLQLANGEVIEMRHRFIGAGGYVAIFADVTAQRMIAYDPAGGSVGIWDRDLRLGTMSWTDPYWSMLGYDPRAVPESVRCRHRDDWPSLVHPDDRELAYTMVERATAGEGSLLFNCRLKHVDGRWLWFGVRGRIMRDERGKPVRAVGTHTQIDVTVRTREALVHARLATEGELRHRTWFLATLGHELRTALTGIVGNLDLLARDLQPGSDHGRVTLLRNASQSLVQVLDGMLEMARAEAGRLAVRHENFAPRQLLAEVAELLDPLARSKGLAARVHVDDKVPMYLCGGLPLLRQILINLISNAIKFTEGGGVSICMLADTGRDRYRIEVCDTGSGMTQATLARVFEKFYREPQGAGSGAGLGLYIVARLVESIGGTIDADSQLNGGTRFRIRLSLAPGRAPEERPVWEPLGPYTLLLVEDVAANREMIRELLMRDGHRVDAVADGAAAVQAVRERPYSAVLMDVHLEGMDGLQAAQQIRALPDPERAATPIIILTAEAGRLVEDFCRLAGIDAVLGKPVQLETLYMVLGEHCAPIKDDAVVSQAGTADGAGDRRLDELTHILGAERVRALLGVLDATLTEQRARLDEAMAGDDREAVKAIAHRVCGAADNFGFAELAHAARKVCSASPTSLIAEAGALRVALDDAQPRVRALARDVPVEEAGDSDTVKGSGAAVEEEA